jgi:OmpA-OmpF porin, OOP family
MNKLLIPVAAAIVLSLTSFPAAVAASETGIFIAASGGNANYDVAHTSGFDKSDHAYSGIVGWRWIMDRPFAFGVEAGYVNLGKLGYSETLHNDVAGFGDPGFDVTTNAKYAAKGVLAGINAKWNLGGNATITARVGAVNTRTSARVSGSLTYRGSTTTYRGDEVHESDTGVYGGLGFGYDFNRHFGMTLTYDHYRFKVASSAIDPTKVNVGVFGVAAEVRF